jgi:hypothetical protein
MQSIWVLLLNLKSKLVPVIITEHSLSFQRSVQATHGINGSTLCGRFKQSHGREWKPSNMVAYKMNLSKKKTQRTQLGLQLSPTNWFWEPNRKTQMQLAQQTTYQPRLSSSSTSALAAKAWATLRLVFNCLYRVDYPCRVKWMIMV